MPFQKGHPAYSTEGRFKKGQPSWNKGKKMSKESRKKMSIYHKGKPTWNKGKKLSEEHKEKLSKSHKRFYKKHPRPKGKKCHSWKGGRIKTYQGYILIKKPKHLFCNCSGYVFEHRLIMEKHLGRYLKPTERIHHINHNKSDNRLKNLMLFPNISKHRKFHLHHCNK